MTTNETFTASNGTEVHIDDRGYLLATGGTGEPDAVTQATGGADFGVQALREFFQHERDTELGRWRDPDNPNMVVYLTTADCDGTRRVCVIDERTGDRYVVFDGDTRYGVFAPVTETAARYFVQHPGAELPSEPYAAFVDKYGSDVWVTDGAGNLRCLSSASSNPQKYAPFTRLIPEK